MSVGALVPMIPACSSNPATQTPPAPNADAGVDAAATAPGDAGVAAEAGICGGRFTTITPGTSMCFDDGSGLVEDGTTGLTWMTNMYLVSECSVPPCASDQPHAAAYCTSVHMRLPTEGEALAISGTPFGACAWPCGWETWTSTSAGSGLAYCVAFSDSTPYTHDITQSYSVLCVR